MKREQDQSTLLVPDLPIEEPHPVIFDQLTGPLICATALKTEGSAGPSGIDAQGWRHLCTSFREASTDLCDALAHLGRHICTHSKKERTDTTCIRVLIECPRI